MAAYLYQTTESKNHKHYFTVDQNLSVKLSKSHGHLHEVVVSQSKEIDPATQQPSQALVFEVFPASGHTHELTKDLNYPRAQTKTEEEATLVQKAIGFLRESESWMETGFFKVARECDKFRSLNQWDPALLAMMPSGKAALQVPIVNAQLDILKGVQMQNKTEPSVTPGDTGDMVTADITGQIIKNILERNQYETIETRAFGDQVDLGLGWTVLSVDFSSDFRGNFKIEYYDWDNCFMGPFNLLDGSDAEHAEKVKWLSVDKLKAMFPDKIEEIDSFSARATQSFSGLTIESGNDIDALSGTPAPMYGNIYDPKKELIKTIECQYKEHRRIKVAFNLETGLYQPLADIKSEEIKNILTIEGVSIAEVTDEKILIALVAGTVLLYQGVSILDRLGMFPAIGKKFKNIIFGKYAEALDMQKNINQSESRMVDLERGHNENQTFFDDDTFEDSEEEEYFLANGVRDPNYVGKVKNTNKIPVKAQPARAPNQSLALDRHWRDRAADLTNVQLANQISPYESNVGMLNKRQHGLLGNEYLFTNSWIATRALVVTIINALPKVYITADRYFRVLDNRYKQGKFMRLDKKDFSSYTEQDIEEIMKDFEPTDYNVFVAESSYSPTKMSKAFENWKEIAKQYGASFPFLINYLIKLDPDIPESQKIEFAQMKEEFMQAQTQGDTTKIEQQGEENVKLEVVKQMGKAKEKGVQPQAALPQMALPAA